MDQVEDYRAPRAGRSRFGMRARDYCAALERGEMLCSSAAALSISLQKTANSCCRSNGPSCACTRTFHTVRRRYSARRFRGMPQLDRSAIHAILRNYSSRGDRFPFEISFALCRQMDLDFASFRPFEEDGRDSSACTNATTCFTWTLFPAAPRAAAAFSASSRISI